jgi:hypothetical protein
MTDHKTDKTASGCESSRPTSRPYIRVRYIGKANVLRQITHGESQVDLVRRMSRRTGSQHDFSKITAEAQQERPQFEVVVDQDDQVVAVHGHFGAALEHGGRST